MRKKKNSARVLSAIIFFAFSLFFFSLNVFAAPDGGDGSQEGETPIVVVDPAPADDPTDAQQIPDSGTVETIPDTPTEPEQTPTEPDADSGDGGNGYDNVIEDIGDTGYTEPEHLDELPTVSPYEVEEATAVVLPDVEVSDASLFSGIVMWLCVAVGVAVVIGVMVSKRTHRRGL